MFNNNCALNTKTIGIIAPSFFIEKKDRFEKGVEYLTERGANLKYGNTVFNKLFNTTGTAIERARDINKMFIDPEVDIIISSDGGCKAIEVLEHLDYEAILNNPKPLCGFSDVTHILLAIYAKTGNPVVHGVDVLNGFGQEESCVKHQNIELFWKNIEGIVRGQQLPISLKAARCLKDGKGTGIAIGGWLNAVHNLVGTEYFPKNDKIVLFWEAIDEEPNRINMMLQSLRVSGLFDKLAGMVVGQLTACVEKEYYDCIPEVSEMILEACDGYSFPILINAPFGHGDEKTPFVFGTLICIDTEALD